MTSRPVVAVAAAVLLAGACAHGRKQARTEPEQAARGRTARTEPGGKQQGMKPPRPGAPRVPPTPEGLLGQDAVGKLQQALAQRGLLGRHRQGELDAPTSAAVKKFQEQRGLAATGMPDRETLRELGVSADEAYGTGGESPSP